jgi:hypothetical protein
MNLNERVEGFDWEKALENPVEWAKQNFVDVIDIGQMEVTRTSLQAVQAHGMAIVEQAVCAEREAILRHLLKLAAGCELLQKKGTAKFLRRAVRQLKERGEVK